MLNEFITNLNPNQREAVLAIKGPVRIIAGAGSGKTRVIINKIAYLIKYGNLKPWRICAVTFTNKAANEMKERIIDLIGSDGKQCSISTYHALCVRILREDIDTLGYNRNFNIIDNQDQDSIFRIIYKKMDYKYDNNEAKLLKSALSNWKNDFISPASASANNSDNPNARRWAHVYKLYQERLLELNSLDFNDLILLTYQLFRDHLTVLAKWQGRFDYFLVDEFQDTNDLQFSIIKWLTGEQQNITVVGDPDQTIYSWRGAKISLILNFDREFKNTETVILDQNYRSSQNILNLANSLIENNPNRIKKELFTANQSGIKPILYHGHSGGDEAEFVAGKIHTLVKNEEVRYQDILILYRANYLSRDIEGALADYGISYHIYGAFKFYERKEIKDALSFLRLLVNNDPLALQRVLLLFPKVGEKTIEHFFELIATEHLTGSDLLINHHELLGTGLANKLEPLKKALIAGQKALQEEKTIGEVLEQLLKESGYLQLLKDNFEEERVENIKELFNSIKKFDQQNSDLNGIDLVNEYLQLMALQTDNDNNLVSEDAVALMTIHNAKGLEKKVVFIIGLNEGIFPSAQAIRGGASQMEEERRTFYVAITRAKEQLFISYADGFSYITNNERFPSRFIKELNENYFDLIETEHTKPESKYIDKFQNFKKDWRISLEDFGSQKYLKNKETDAVKNQWKINDTVNHELFGTGVVVKIIAQNIQIVFPSPIGSKIISADSKAITKG
ncbi:ATP-dependent helicase [Spiroplasma chrysopicola]|uniref:DNA 3'-5' helicase n=1 Tax=Spiroplasma chrysopicola DF-1 TaxID=1276227 RepID=R4UFA0_9MOLU|nr:UvrD-helicase domain-containing protein [Spiroplasma chrysopicola]AGM24810.1 ATP-dependent DNA helicase [Spiroplasma chrysopicola DF-1]